MKQLEVVYNDQGRATQDSTSTALTPLCTIHITSSRVESQRAEIKEESFFTAHPNATKIALTPLCTIYITSLLKLYDAIASIASIQ